MSRWLVWGMGIVLLLGGTAGCSRGGEAKPAKQPELIGTDWSAHRIRGEAVALKKETQRPHFRLDQKEKWMSGFTGCNRMFGSYEIEGSRLWFGGVGATKMACEETMALEQAFLEALQATTQWRIDDGVLRLWDDQGRELLQLREGQLEMRPGG